MTFLSVGLGGAVGSMARYGLGVLSVKWNIPLMTFMINITGAIVMGFIVGITMTRKDISSNTILFFKVGLCGGFTTFSALSLEVLNMLENNHILAGVTYALASMVTCVIGVWIGIWMGRKIA
ncbi:MAG: fluoride efflux transporter CrcB [Anaerovoracaceae bacterium]